MPSIASPAVRHFQSRGRRRTRSTKSLTATEGANPAMGMTRSPGTPSGSRLVAIIRRPGTAPTRVWARTDAWSMTCSQLSSTTTKRTTGEVVHDVFRRRFRVDGCRRPSTLLLRARGRDGGDSFRIGDTGKVDQPGAAGVRSRSRAAISVARRVLPTPPGPISVTKRLDRTASPHARARRRARQSYSTLEQVAREGG